MRGRRASERTRATGPYPDWSAVAWYVYRDTADTSAGVFRRHRVAPRELSPGELRRHEALAAVVRRCSMATVRDLLRRGVPAEGLQAAADGLADAQANRAPATEPNAYRALVAKLRAEARAWRELKRAVIEEERRKDAA